MTARSLGSSDSIYQTKAVGFDLAGRRLMPDDRRELRSHGAYSFRLLDLGQALAITPGTSVSQQALTPANSTNAYQFNVTAGQRFYFDLQSLSAYYSPYCGCSIRMGRRSLADTRFRPGAD